MNVLVFAEQRGTQFKKSAFEAVTTGRRLADALGGACSAVVVGNGISADAGELGKYGAMRVLAVDQASLDKHAPMAWSTAIVDAAKSVNAGIVVLSATQMGKDLAPRVAVALGAGLASDCTDVQVRDAEVIATRPVYAGKAIIDVRITTPAKVVTLRPNVFPATGSGAAVPVESLSAVIGAGEYASVVVETKVATGRPDVAEADVVVSGGRGMKGPEHFRLIEELADALHAGVGASRAVVDAGWRPHSEQVGQTGKTVSPALYIACAISGAVQHLAGMSSSKYIVAINKDKDAPIFQVADYGIAGDVFEILPELTVQLKQAIHR